jgi:hypothetical protein
VSEKKHRFIDTSTRCATPHGTGSRTALRMPAAKNHKKSARLARSSGRRSGRVVLDSVVLDVVLALNRSTRSTRAHRCGGRAPGCPLLSGRERGCTRRDGCGRPITASAAATTCGSGVGGTLTPLLLIGPELWSRPQRRAVQLSQLIDVHHQKPMRQRRRRHRRGCACFLSFERGRGAAQPDVQHDRRLYCTSQNWNEQTAQAGRLRRMSSGGKGNVVCSSAHTQAIASSDEKGRVRSFQLVGSQRNKLLSGDLLHER